MMQSGEKLNTALMSVARLLARKSRETALSARRVLAVLLALLLLLGAPGVLELPAAFADAEETVEPQPEATPEPQPEVTPELPETTPELPEATPELPETTPEQPEETPEQPEETPEQPEETPELPEETTEPADTSFSTRYLGVTVYGGEALSFAPAEIKGEQLSLPETDEGVYRLIEARSFVGCDAAEIRAMLSREPEHEENEELRLVGLSHRWLDAEGRPIEPGDPVGADGYAARELFFSLDSALFRCELQAGHWAEFCTEKLSGMALLAFTPAEERGEDEADETDENSETAETAETAGTAEAGEEPEDEEEAPDTLRELIATDGSSYRITVRYDSELSGIPADAKLIVEELFEDSDNYQDYVEGSAEKLDVSVERISFARVFDIYLLDPNTERHIQPDENVTVIIEFLSEKPTAEQELSVVHFGEKVEEMDSSVANGAVEFDTDGFSVFTVIETALSRTITTSDGASYDIQVTYQDTAGLPMKGTELLVSEIRDGDEGYERYIEQSAEALGVPQEELELSRVFDISIVSAEDHSVSYEPTGKVDVSIRLIGTELDRYGRLDVLHFEEDEDGSAVRSMGGSASGESLAFSTDGFSVYAVVAGPAPLKQTLGTVEDLAAGYNDSQGFYLSVTRNNVINYFTNTLNGNSAFIVTTDIASASTWYFAPVSGQSNQYYIYTKINGSPRYMKNTSGNLMGLVSENGTPFEVSQAASGVLWFNVAGTEKYLQYSNGGLGIRLYDGTGTAANSQITVTIISSLTIADDVYGLDGVSHGLVSYRSGTSANAMLTTETVKNGVQMLGQKSLLIRSDPMDQSRTLYVAKDSDIPMWTFHSIAEDRYYLTSDTGKYLRIDGSNLTLVDEADAYCVLQVIPGTGNRQGKVRLLGVEAQKAVSYISNSSSFCVGSSSGATEWLNFADLSVYSEDDFVMYSATKVSASDRVNVCTGKAVVIYTRVWNDSEKAYEFYAIDHNGDLIPCYESGDALVWVGTQNNTLLWEFTEYCYEGTTTPNYYYEFQNMYTGKYIAPQIAGDQIFSDHTIGVNLNGRRYGDYYTPIIAWDEANYDYAGLKTENGKVVSCPMSQAESFYVAVMQMSTPGQPTPVATVDHEALGLTMRMIDYNGPIRESAGSGYSPTTERQYSVMGTQLYTEHAVQPNLLSTDLQGGDSGYPTAKLTGRSLSELFSGAATVNHLFIQSIYDGSGYYQFDSTENFAHLSGSQFEVYQELGTVKVQRPTRRHGQFMPYNTLDMSRAHSDNPLNLTDILGHDLSDNYPRKNETLYGFNEPEDHYFGMEIEGHFMQTPNGVDAWGHDIVFEFVGDDDFWLYVDGELVIDLGGIHSALKGTVNYSTGKVVVNGTNTTLRDIFKKNYAARMSLAEDDPAVTAYLDGIFQAKTVNGQTQYVFKDYSAHTVRIFYMERGAGASNLRMRFNLATVTPGQVLLSKEISGTEKQDYATMKFPFQIYYNKNDGTGDHLLERTQDTITMGYNVVYQNTSTPVEYRSSDVIDGVTYEHLFYLKPGQTAAIKVPDDTVDYWIRECGVDDVIYDSVTINDVETTGETLPGATETKCYSSTSAAVADRAKITFTNHVDQSALRTLTIKKILFDAEDHPLTALEDPTVFQMRMYLGEDLEYYRLGEYYIKDPNGNYCYYDTQAQRMQSIGVSHFENLTDIQLERVTFKTSPSGAISKVPAGYSIEIRDLLVGTKFKVEERESEIPIGYGLRTWTEGSKTYTGYKRVEGSFIVGEDDAQNSGVIRDRQSPIIEIHNRRGWGLRADKVWSDADFMQSHDDTYFAVYVGGQMLPDTLRKIDAGNRYALYYFPALQTGASFADYEIREVLVGEDAGGQPTYTPIADNGSITLGGTPNDGAYQSDLDYRACYNQGDTESSVGSLNNIRRATVTNLRVGGLTILKTAPDGTTGLAGAEFILSSSEDTVGTYSSDSEGLVTVAYLEDGVYTLTETKAPAQHQAKTDPITITVANGSFTVTENGSPCEDFDSASCTLTVRNKPFTLQVKKVDAKTNEAIADVHFALYRQIQGSNGPRRDYYPMEGYADLVTDADGFLTTVNGSLPAGVYYLVEKEAPSGYVEAGEIVFEISRTGLVTLEATEDAQLVQNETETNIGYTLLVKNRAENLSAPTGLHFRIEVYVLMLLFGCGILAAALYHRKRREERSAAEELPIPGPTDESR